MNSYFIIPVLALLMWSSTSQPNLKTESVYSYTVSDDEVVFSADLRYQQKDIMAVTDYNQAGQKVKEEKYQDHKIKSIHYFEYTDHKLSKVTIDTSYNYYHTHELLSYPADFIACRSEYNRENLKRTFCVKRNAAGKALKSLLINSKGDTIQTTVYNYDIHGREITRIEYNKKKKMTFGYHSVYSGLDTICTSHILFDRKGKKFIAIEVLKNEKDKSANSSSIDLLNTNFQENRVDTLKIITYQNEQNLKIKEFRKRLTRKKPDDPWKVTEYKYDYY